MRLIWQNRKWRCTPEGPHGPTPCGPLPYETARCACGCNDYYGSCQMQKQWFEEQSKLKDARHVCPGCEQRHMPPWCPHYDEEKK